MNNFKAGDKVVCIESGHTNDGTLVIEGEIYTVSAPCFNYLTYVAVMIREKPDCIWDASRFKKVQNKGMSTAASKELAWSIELGDELAKKKDKYLPEEKEIVLDEPF